MRFISKLFIASTIILLQGLAMAEPVSVPIPEQAWQVRFESPAPIKLASKTNPKGYAFVGNAGKLNVSVFAEQPSCAEGDANEARYKCFLAKAAKIPYLVPSSLRANVLPTGVQVSYLVQAEVQGNTLQALNVHLLFSHKGMEGDVHASMVLPEAKEVQSLFALIGSVQLVDE